MKALVRFILMLLFVFSGVGTILIVLYLGVSFVLGFFRVTRDLSYG